MSKKKPHSIWSPVIDIEWKKELLEEENILIGYGSVFGNIDEHGDIIEKGAFKKTIKERIPRGLVKLLDSHIHASSHVIGTIIEAEEDDYGLRIKAKIASTEHAQQIKKLIQEGHMSKMSVGFDIVSENWERREGQAVRIIKEAKLYEISVVGIPANDQARIISVKSLVPYQDLKILNTETKDYSKEGSLDRLKEFSKTKDGEMKWNTYRKGFIWFDTNEPLEEKSYFGQIGDVIDGELKVIPEMLLEVSKQLKEKENLPDAITEEDIELIKKELIPYFERLDIEPLWTEEIEQQEEKAGQRHSKSDLEKIKTSVLSLIELLDDEQKQEIVKSILPSAEPLKETLTEDKEKDEKKKEKTLETNSKLKSFNHRARLLDIDLTFKLKGDEEK